METSVTSPYNISINATILLIFTIFCYQNFVISKFPSHLDIAYRFKVHIHRNFAVNVLKTNCYCINLENCFSASLFLETIIPSFTLASTVWCLHPHWFWCKYDWRLILSLLQAHLRAIIPRGGTIGSQPLLCLTEASEDENSTPSKFFPFLGWSHKYLYSYWATL